MQLNGEIVYRQHIPNFEYFFTVCHLEKGSTKFIFECCGIRRGEIVYRRNLKISRRLFTFEIWNPSTSTFRLNVTSLVQVTSLMTMICFVQSGSITPKGKITSLTLRRFFYIYDNEICYK